MPLLAAIALSLSCVMSHDDKPLPSIEALVSSLEQSESGIENLSVTTDYVKLQKFGLPVEEPVRMSLTSTFVVDRSGRSRYEGWGEQVNSGPNRQVNIFRGRWRTTFDGKEARSLTGSLEGEFHFGSIERYPAWHGVNPWEYTTRYNQQPVSEQLKNPNAQVIGWERWEGRPVVVADTKVTTRDNHGWKARFLVDPERGIVVRRSLFTRKGEDGAWREYSRIESRELTEAAPGIWLPKRMKYESVEPEGEGRPEVLSWSYEGTNSDWKVNQKLPDELFTLSFPDGVSVTDHTVGGPVRR
jgi:hypothetical protein